MKQPRIRTVFLGAATVSIVAMLVIVFAAFFEYFHIGGSEFPWAGPADNEAAVTVEVYDGGIPVDFESIAGKRSLMGWIL